MAVRTVDLQDRWAAQHCSTRAAFSPGSISGGQGRHLGLGWRGGDDEEHCHDNTTDTRGSHYSHHAGPGHSGSRSTESHQQ